MDFHILGRLEVFDDGGRSVSVSGRKERALLALLVVHANRFVSLDRLIEELWAGDPPDQAVATARVYVSRLRKTLGSDLIVTEAPGYELRLAPERIDATRFELLTARARELLAAERIPEAATLFRDALGLWRGPALAEVADMNFARPEVTRLTELRLGALEGRIQADLALGRHGELVGELEVLTTEYPLREGFWAARMLALYRAGRQAEALRAYQAARAALGDVGVEPGPALARLEAEILAQEIRPPSPPATGSPDASLPSSAVVTLLFTDLVASTTLLERLGDDAAESLRREHDALVRRRVASHGGEEVKNLGDALMVAFASALDALSCAVDIQQGVARHNRRHPERVLEVRVGLHVGEPIRDEADYLGTPVVVAKCLCDRAEGGQILASRLVATLVGRRGEFIFHDIGDVSPRGFSVPVAACALDWAERPAVRFPLPPSLADRGAAFVGRRDELAKVRSVWERTEAGDREVLLVAGEPGIGKTTLVTKAARAAHEVGAVVLFGHCDEEALVPFQPFVETLEHYIAVCPAPELRAQLGHDADQLALLLPTLSRRVPEVGEPAPSGADTQRYRLFEAVATFIATIADQAPVMLVLDDLHWADRPTLQLLVHVVRRVRGVPLLILGTYRDTDLGRTHPMAEALVELRRADVTDRILLRGLGSNDVVQLVSGGTAPGPEDEALGAALWAQSEGSPLFVREILRHLEETEGVERDAGGRYRAQRAVQTLGIPEGIKEVIGRRLDRLADTTNALLRAGSVMGREFRADVVAGVADAPMATVLDALDEAERAGVVAEVPGVAGSYAFTHALVRETLYDELSLTRRVLLHRDVGETVEALHADDLEPYLAELAYHFSQAAVAGQATKGIDYATRAGARAMAQLAYEDAARHFTMALEVGRDLGVAEEKRVDLLLALGEAEWRSSDTDVARATFQRAAEGARRLGDAERVAAAALGHAGSGIRWFWVAVMEPNALVTALLEEALEMLGEGDTALRARVMGALAQELAINPEAAARAEALSAEAVAMARRVGDTATLGYTLCARNGTVGDSAAHLDERLANADEATALARGVGDPNLAALAHQFRFAALLQGNDVSGAREALGNDAAAARSLGDPIMVQWVLHREGLLAQLEGRFDEATRLHERGFRMGTEARDPDAFVAMVGSLAVDLWLKGRLDEYVGGFELALAARPVPFLLAAAASTRAQLGHAAECRAWADQVELGDLGPPFFPADAYLLARACAFLDDRDRCGALYELLAPYADHNVVTASVQCWGPVSYPLGLLASALGRHAEALAHFGDAISRCRANGWDPVMAWMQLDQAVALRAEGSVQSRELARQALAEVLETAHRLGLPRVAGKARRLLDDVNGDHSRPGPTGGAVTRRDRTRARLVAGGRRAAARLVHGADDDRLARRFGSPAAQRALMGAMARAFQPAMARGFAGDISFELAAADGDVDAPASWWTVEVRDGKATARAGRSDDATLTLHADVGAFVHFAVADLDLTAALVRGRIWAEGDFASLMRLGTMFGAVAPFDVPGQP